MTQQQVPELPIPDVKDRDSLTKDFQDWWTQQKQGGARQGKTFDAWKYAQTPGYTGKKESYYEEPWRLARWRNAAGTLAETAPPEWADPAGLETAYQYMKLRNHDMPWWAWKKLPDDDPGLDYIRSLPTPPDELMLPAEQRIYSPFPAGPASTATGVNETAQAAQVYNPYNAPDLTQFTDEDWAKLPSWQRFMYVIMSNPEYQGVATMLPFALAGGIAGAAGGPIGAAVGFGAPLITGYGLGQLASPETQEWMEKNLGKGAATILGGGSQAVMNWLNIPAQGVESLLGAGYQATMAGLQPEKYGTFEEVIQNFLPAWRAGRIAYEVSETGSVPIVSQIAPGIEWLIDMALSGRTDVRFTDANEVYVLGKAEPQQVDPALIGGLGMVQYRRELMSGADPEETFLKYQQVYGYSGTVTDLMYQIGADPLNILPKVTRVGIAKYARYIDNPTMALAAKLAIGEGFLGTKRVYGQLLRAGYGPDAVQMSARQLRLAGLTPTGVIAELQPGKAPAARVAVGKAIARTAENPFSPPLWLIEMKELTPASRARALLGMAHENAGVLLDLAGDDPAQMFKLMRSWADLEPPEAKGVATMLGLPEAATVRQGMAAYSIKLNETEGLWKTGQARRTLLFKISDILGESPARVLELLNDTDGAKGVHQGVLDAVKLKDADTAAKLAADPAFTPEALRGMASWFDENPWHPQHLKAILHNTLLEHIADWSIKAYGVAPDNKFLRFTSGLKSVQSLLLLGFNPAYAINNKIGNTVHRIYDGTFGLVSQREITRFFDEFGIEPYRLRAGVGAADIGVETAGLKKVQKVGEVFREAGFEEATKLGMAAAEQKIRINSRAGDYVQTFQDLARSAQNLGVVSKWSMNMERRDSAASMYYGVRQAWDRLWTRSGAIGKLPEGLANEIKKIDPRLIDALYAAAERSIDQTQLGNILAGTMVRRSLDDYIPEAAKKLGLSQGDLREMMKTSGVWQAIEGSLARGATVVDAFAGAEQMIRQNLDQKLTRDLITRAAAAEVRVRSEGFGAGLDLFVDIQLKLEQLWTTHFAEWERTFQMAYAPGVDAAARQAMIRERMAIQDAEWKSHQDWTHSTWDGVLKALGFGETSENVKLNAFARKFATGLIDLDSMWREFYVKRTKVYKEYFDKLAGGEMNRDARAAAWYEVQKNLSDLYEASYVDEHKRLVDTAVDVVQMWVDRYGAQRAKGAAEWMKATVELAAERHSMMKAFRAWERGEPASEITDVRVLELVGGMDPNDKHVVWPWFVKELYLPQIGEIVERGRQAARQMYNDVNDLNPPPGEPPKGPEGEPGPGPTTPGDGRQAIDDLNKTIQQQRDQLDKAMQEAKEAAPVEPAEEEGPQYQGIMGPRSEIVASYRDYYPEKFLEEFSDSMGSTARMITMTISDSADVGVLIDDVMGGPNAKKRIGKQGDWYADLYEEYKMQGKKLDKQAVYGALDRIARDVNDDRIKPGEVTIERIKRIVLDHMYNEELVDQTIMEGFDNHSMYEMVQEGRIDDAARSLGWWLNSRWGDTTEAEWIRILGGQENYERVFERYLELASEEPERIQSETTLDGDAYDSMSDESRQKLVELVGDVKEEERIESTRQEWEDERTTRASEIDEELERPEDLISADEIDQEVEDFLKTMGMEEAPELPEGLTPPPARPPEPSTYTIQNQGEAENMLREVFGYEPDIAAAEAGMMQAAAETWSKRTGRPVTDFWTNLQARRLNQAARDNPDMLTQVIKVSPEEMGIDRAKVGVSFRYYRARRKLAERMTATLGREPTDAEINYLVSQRSGIGELDLDVYEYLGALAAKEWLVRYGHVFGSQAGDYKTLLLERSRMVDVDYVDYMKWTALATNARNDAIAWRGRAVYDILPDGSGLYTWQGKHYYIKVTPDNQVMAIAPGLNAAKFDTFADAAGWLYQQAEVTDWNGPLYQSAPGGRWYSRLERVVESIPQEKLTLDQLRAAIRRGGVKADELEWTGFAAWMDERNPNTVQRKAEALEFIRRNQVVVEEVLKKERQEYEYTDTYVEVDTGAEDRWIVRVPGEESGNFHVEEQDGEWLLWYLPKDREPVGLGAYPTRGDAFSAARSDYVDTLNLQQSSKPKYEKYTLPGGENYRELLLTLPKDKVPLEFAPEYQSSHWEEENILAHVRFKDRLGPDGEKVLFIEEIQSDWHQAGREKGYYQKANLPDYVPPESSLTSTGNGMWHVYNTGTASGVEIRVNQRSGRPQYIEAGMTNLPEELISRLDTARVEEELRSSELDYGLFGVSFQHPDYPNDPSKRLWSTFQSITRAGAEKQIEKWRDFYSQPAERVYYKIAGDTNEYKTLSDAFKTANERLMLAAVYREQQRRNYHEEPDYAPFAKTWPELTMKRMLAWAAENGYDQIAWTTGKQQAERYNLRNFEVGKILYEPLADGVFRRVIVSKTNGDMLWAGTDVTPQELRGVIGNEPTRMMETGAGGRHDDLLKVIRADELPVESVGMNAFYDQILPEVAQKLGKKWGVSVWDREVESSVLDTSPGYYGWYIELGDGSRFEVGGEEQRFQTEDMARSYIDANTRYYPSLRNARPFDADYPTHKKLVTVHSMTIPYTMRQALQAEGQPLFQEIEPSRIQGAYEPLPDGKRIITAFQNADVTTWLHESAHFYFEYALDDPSMEVVRQFAGVDDLLGENYRTAQEAFADGYVRWRREGRAPNTKIKAMFIKFRDYLWSVWESLTSRYKVAKDWLPGKELSPEMENVYRRLFELDPWEMTLEQYRQDYGITFDDTFGQVKHIHRAEVKRAIQDGRTVPDRVLEQYPELRDLVRGRLESGKATDIDAAAVAGDLPPATRLLPYAQHTTQPAKRVAHLLEKLGLSEVVMGDEVYEKIVNDPYLDLVIETHKSDQGAPLLYLTHYVEQNGDMMIDTEMVFYVRKDGTLHPYEYRFRGPMGEVRVGYNERGAKELFNVMSKNLLDQGFGAGALVTREPIWNYGDQAMYGESMVRLEGIVRLGQDTVMVRFDDGRRVVANVTSLSRLQEEVAGPEKVAVPEAPPPEQPAGQMDMFGPAPEKPMLEVQQGEVSEFKPQQEQPGLPGMIEAPEMTTTRPGGEVEGAGPMFPVKPTDNTDVNFVRGVLKRIWAMKPGDISGKLSSQEILRLSELAPDDWEYINRMTLQLSNGKTVAGNRFNQATVDTIKGSLHNRLSPLIDDLEKKANLPPSPEIVPPSAVVTPVNRANLIDHMKPLLLRVINGEDVKRAEFEALGKAAGLSMDSGADINLIYDTMEGAANLLVREVRKELDEKFPVGKVPETLRLQERLERLAKIEEALPRARRTFEKTDLQQFSTPITIAEGAGYVADVRPGDVVGEDTAGTGNLVEMFQGRDDVTIRVNEIDEGRLNVLRQLGYDPTSFNLMDPDWVIDPDTGKLRLPNANVKIVNPPWGAYATGKYGKAIDIPVKMNDWSQRFAYLIDYRLAEGGRLVMVMPTNWLFTTDRTTRQNNYNTTPFYKWMDERYTIQGVIESPEGAYDARATGVDSLLIVVDKRMRGQTDAVQVKAYGDTRPDSWFEYAKALAEVPTRVFKDVQNGQKIVRQLESDTATSRRPATGPDSTGLSDPAARRGESRGEPGDIGKFEPEPEPGPAPERQPGAEVSRPRAGTSEQPVTEQPAAEPSREVELPERPVEDTSGGTLEPGGAAGIGGEPAPVQRPGERPGETTQPGAGGERRPAAAPMVGRQSQTISGRNYIEPVDYSETFRSRLDESRRAADSSRNFALYVPRSPIQPDDVVTTHPTAIVETKSLAGVPYPELEEAYRPSAGVMRAMNRMTISMEGNLDAIWSAVQQNDKHGAGVLIADDVGVGKSRTAAGFAIDRIERGKKRILVITDGHQNVNNLMNKEFPGVWAGTANEFSTYTSIPDEFPARRVRISAETMQGVKKGEEPLPMFPNEPAVYFISDHEVIVFAEQLKALGPDVVIVDEAHNFKNVDGITKKAVAWTDLHKDWVASGANFMYLTATPGIDIADLKYLYGLKVWTVDGFEDWLGIITGNVTAEEAQRRSALLSQADDLVNRMSKAVEHYAPVKHEKTWRETWDYEVGKYLIDVEKSYIEIWGKESGGGGDYLRYGTGEQAAIIIAGIANEQNISLREAMRIHDREYGDTAAQLINSANTAGMGDAHDLITKALNAKPGQQQRTPKRSAYEYTIPPAHTEQIMRELKQGGSYMSRDISRSGVYFDMEEVKVEQRLRDWMDRRIDLYQDIYDAFNKFGKFNQGKKKNAAMFGINGDLQADNKRSMFHLRLPATLDIADESIRNGQKVVISLISVSDVQGGGKLLENAISKINTQKVDKLKGGGYSNPEEIPEATIVLAELREKLADLGDTPSPIDMLRTHFGNRIAFITGKEDTPIRERAAELFQMDAIDVIVISSAGKTGINLHDITGKRGAIGPDGKRHGIRVIEADYEWSATNFKQGLGRTDRTGELTSPWITMLHTGSAVEKKFVSTIANRMLGIGATSKGAAESTGVDPLTKDFELGTSIDKLAMVETWRVMDRKLRNLFHDKYFDDPQVASVKRATLPGTENALKKFLLALQIIPLDLGNKIWDLFEAKRIETYNASQGDEDGFRLSSMRKGKVERETEFGSNLRLTEVQDDLGDVFAVVNGTLTPEMKRIRNVVAPDFENQMVMGAGPSAWMKWMQFYDPEAARYISGLFIRKGKVAELARVFGQKLGGGFKPETALRDLQLGERIPIFGDQLKPWELYIGKAGSREGRIVVDGPKIADRQALMNNGARFSDVGTFFYIPEENLQAFLKRFPIRNGDEEPPRKLYQVTPDGEIEPTEAAANYTARVIPDDFSVMWMPRDIQVDGFNIRGMVFRDAKFLAYVPEKFATMRKFNTQSGKMRLLGVDGDGHYVLAREKAGEWIIEKRAMSEGDMELGTLPLGVTDSMTGIEYDSQTGEDAMSTWLRPAMDEIKREMLDDKGQGMQYKGALGQQLNPLTRDAKLELNSWVNTQKQEMSKAKLAAIRYGERKRDFSLLNYSKRYGFDGYLASIYPYQFWYTRSMLNWMTRLADKPALAAHFAKLTDFMSTYEDDTKPSRLKNKIRIPAAFLPEWAGGGLYVDPLSKIAPWSQFSQPLEMYIQNQNKTERRASTILQEMVDAGKVSQEDANTALTTRKGPAWQQATSAAQAEDGGDTIDFMSLFTSPALYLSMPYRALTGKGAKNQPLPLSRELQAAASLLDMPGIRRADIEATIRNKEGLSEFGEWGAYYVDRQLANMAGEGLINSEQAIQAMVERSGDVYDQAYERVRMELALRQPMSSTIAAAKKGDVGGMIGSLLFGYLPAGLLPEGELKQRQLGERWNQARESYNKTGNSDLIEDFFSQYPEYKARLALYDEPEERLKQFLISNVWEKWSEMQSLQKQTAAKQLGPVFQEQFLDTNTRDYDTIQPETLAMWSQALGGWAPEKTAQMALTMPAEADSQAYQDYLDQRNQEFPNISKMFNFYYELDERGQEKFKNTMEPYWKWRDQYLADHPEVIPLVTSEESQLAGADQATAALVYEYRATKETRFPGIYDVQDGYYAKTSSSAKKKYLLNHPELKAYWDWQRATFQAHPEVIPYIKSIESLAKSVLGENYIEPVEYQAPAAIPPQDLMKLLSPALVRTLSSYYVSNQKLGEGSRKSLELVWKQLGKPRGSLQGWIETDLKASFTK